MSGGCWPCCGCDPLPSRIQTADQCLFEPNGNSSPNHYGDAANKAILRIPFSGSLNVLPIYVMRQLSYTQGSQGWVFTRRPPGDPPIPDPSIRIEAKGRVGLGWEYAATRLVYSSAAANQTATYEQPAGSDFFADLEWVEAESTIGFCLENIGYTLLGIRYLSRLDLATRLMTPEEAAAATFTISPLPDAGPAQPSDTYSLLSLAATIDGWNFQDIYRSDTEPFNTAKRFFPGIGNGSGAVHSGFVQAACRWLPCETSRLHDDNRNAFANLDVPWVKTILCASTGVYRIDE